MFRLTIDALKPIAVLREVEFFWEVLCFEECTFDKD